ncbi:EAL domain-containing protein [Rhodocyclus tenuis]|uniref:bifunctional diguanylate cyclase/phosphodiesterase n=1 Tax=Rhodocyclus tenuis TaxID=1066 RepID=UPI001906B25D|nr:EAL domain-containing protein [Rhodocyclus tenuis]MBK1679662.1 hypothetical protein [Rhodocyclus tenuis]
MKSETKLGHLNAWLFLAGIGALLTASATGHDLLFHTLAELFVIALSFSIFSLTWACRHNLNSSYLIVLGAAYGSSGLVDALHILTVRELQLIPALTSSQPTWFWLTTRCIEVIAALAAPLLIARKVNFGRAAAAFAALALAIYLAIGYGGWSVALPDGGGLTPINNDNETLIIVLLLGAHALLWHVRGALPPGVFPLLAASQLLALVTGICLIRHNTSGDFIAELGHYCRFASVILIYAAIVLTGVRRPAQQLQQEQAEKELRLARVNNKLLASEERNLRVQSVGGFGGWHLDIAADELTCSDEACRIFGIPAGTAMSMKSFLTCVHADDHARVSMVWQAALAQRAPYDLEHRIIADGQIKWVRGRAELELDDDGRAVAALGSVQDITEQRRSEDAIRTSEARLRRAELASGSGNWELHLDARTMHASEGASKLYGVPEGSLDLEIVQKIPLPEYRPLLDAALRNLVEQQIPYDVEFKIRVADSGEIRDIHSIAIYDASTRIVFGIIQDISERKRTEARLQLAAGVFTHAREGITITDPDGNIVEVNDAFTRISGYSREEVIGQNPRILKSGRQPPEFYEAMWRELSSQGHWSGEIWNRRKDGEIYAEILTISAVLDGNGKTRNYIALFTDITPIKEHQKQLERIAHYDILTGLPNRVLLADRLQQAIAQSQRRGQSVAVAYLDLDGFKAVNDRHGHDVGDELLIAIAQRMKEALREGDTLSRIGGDEFVAVLVDLERPQDCQPVLERLLRASASRIALDDLTLQVSASIGVTLYPQDGADADLLLRHADQALYVAKEAGKNRYHLFDVEQDAAVTTQRETLKHIERALARGELVLYYQPKVNMQSGAVIGAEALIRWQHPERGLLLPAAFLPVVEGHPLAVEMGEWVIDSALQQMAEWRAAGLDIPVSVNISAHQLQQDDFVPRLSALLARHPQIPASRLQLEVLETSALEDVAHVSGVMRGCHELGCDFALDDFGTGYSSLSYLKRLPAELIKIDQSFVRGMLDDLDDLAIVEGVLGLAAAFRRGVIAEGVESIAHGELLLSMGCQQAQGYAIARPMPGGEFPEWAANWRPDAAWTVWNKRSPCAADREAVFAEVELGHWRRAIDNHLANPEDVRLPVEVHDRHFCRWQETAASTRGQEAGFQSLLAAHARVRRAAVEPVEVEQHPDSDERAEVARQLQMLRTLIDRLIGDLRSLLRTETPTLPATPR